jgi:hypothetical protein
MPEAPRDRGELSQLFNGCSISMLGQIFGLDNREVARRIVDLEPSGERDGHPTYALAEAARYLVDPIIDLEEYIRTLKPSDLPVPLQKAFWEGKVARIKFEESAKHLWRTDKVMDVFVGVFKRTRSTLVMFDDTIESAVGLNEAQRKLIRQMADQLLNDIRENLIDEFQLNGHVSHLQDVA